MIIFISRRDDDLKVQNLINITCYEALSKLRDVDERQILHTVFIRDISDAKTSSSLIEFFLRRRIDHLSFHSMRRSNKNAKTERFIFFQSAKKMFHSFFVKKALLQLIITLLLMCHKHNK
jgi:hypothetical protein